MKTKRLINSSGRFTRAIFLLFTMLIPGFSNAQVLTKHKWENRLLLVLTDDTSNGKYQDQLQEFKKNLDGIKERKLLIYQITPEKFKLGFENSKWKKSETVYQQFKKTDSQPEIILIGLDGGVKLQVPEFLSAKKLFATIDVMPMRIQEINRMKNTQNSK